MQKHSQHNNDERTQFFRNFRNSFELSEGYITFHFIWKSNERVCVRGELETEQRLQHIDAHQLLRR